MITALNNAVVKSTKKFKCIVLKIDDGKVFFTRLIPGNFSSKPDFIIEHGEVVSRNRNFKSAMLEYQIELHNSAVRQIAFIKKTMRRSFPNFEFPKEINEIF